MKLKFKIFDKLSGNMIYPDKGYQGHYTISLNGKFHDLSNGSGGEEYIVLPFVGIQDRDGKDLYLGDIVEYFGRKFEIIFEDFGFKFKNEIGAKINLKYFNKGEEFKTIGNKYEIEFDRKS